MNTRWLAFTVAILMSGCLGAEDADPEGGGDSMGEESQAAVAEPFRLVWDGYVAAAPLDVFMHARPSEDAMYEVQPSGFSLDITGEPTVIEVLLEWEGEGAFVLHPHYVVNHDETLGGDTEYYGYLSDVFDSSPGCMQIPVADVAAGQWQMMIHPRDDEMRDMPFTITVGILGGEASERDEFHGHRWDGDTIMEDHGFDACQFLLEEAA